MVTLPQLRDYSAEEQKEFSALSPALDRYAQLLEKNCQSYEDELRLRRHKHWVAATAATLSGTFSSEEVCQYWSEQTQEILCDAWAHHQLDTEPIALIAFGKLGARELNLSSDVDIFLLSEEEATSSMKRKVRKWIQSLTEVSALGFCYRIDLDLRPGGTQSPMITSFDSMTNHFGYRGETWERLAMVRFHGLTGPGKLINDAAEFCEKFSYRRHLDYSLFHDLYAMRQKLHDFHFQNKENNIKFCDGGIRDLELFVHSLQLIHGSRNQKLRTRSTTKAINELATNNHINSEDASRLLNGYWFLRQLENKIQCIEDQHSYRLPHKTKLICKADIQTLREHCAGINAMVNDFLQPYQQQSAPSTETLKQKYSDLIENSSDEEWTKIFDIKIKSRSATSTDIDKRRFFDLCFSLIKQHSHSPEFALGNLRDFVAQTRGKASFFALFNEHEKLTSEIIWIFSYSPYLSQMLINRPELADSFLIRSIEIDTQDEESFHTSLRDYKLLSDLIASSTFMRNRELTPFINNLSRTTDFIANQLLSFFSNKLQTTAPRILTLGKWAGHEMGLKSDLDFIFVSSDSNKKLQTKIARRFINTLQTQTPSMYDIDLRLRPSGNAGPLLIEETELEIFLSESAAPWQYQAYLKARFLGEETTADIHKVKKLSQEDFDELYRIHSQLLISKENSLNLKYAPGGIVDTEFTIQIELMKQQKIPTTPANQSMLNALGSHNELQTINNNYSQLRQYQQLFILLSGGNLSSLTSSSEAFQRLGHLLKIDHIQLFQTIQQTLEQQKALLQSMKN